MFTPAASITSLSSVVSYRGEKSCGLQCRSISPEDISDQALARTYIFFPIFSRAICAVAKNVPNIPPRRSGCDMQFLNDLAIDAHNFGVSTRADCFGTEKNSEFEVASLVDGKAIASVYPALEKDYDVTTMEKAASASALYSRIRKIKVRNHGFCCFSSSQDDHILCLQKCSAI